MIDVERLKHDRDYWDSPEVDAPKDATHYIFSNKEGSGIKPGFYREKTDMYVVCGGAAYWWKGSDITVIPRPTRKQWSGPEDGLPPVEVECESALAGGGYRAGHITYKSDQIIVWIDKLSCHEYATRPTDRVFRPLKSEKERVVDYWLPKMQYPGSDSTRIDLEELYELGALKMPEEEQ